MPSFFFRLLPPRPTFPADRTPAEAALMEQHVAYWTALMDRGLVAAFGPVADPGGAYGIAIVRLGEGDDPGALAAADPVVAADVGFRAEVHPMPRLVLPGGG